MNPPEPPEPSEPAATSDEDSQVAEPFMVLREQHRRLSQAIEADVPEDPIDAALPVGTDPIEALRATWTGWDIVAIDVTPRGEEGVPVPLGSAETAPDASVPVVLKHREQLVWATTFLTVAGRFPAEATRSSWEHWTAKQCWMSLRQSISTALVSQTGLYDMFESINLSLQEVRDPADRAGYDYEQVARLLLGLDETDPAWSADLADEIRAVKTLAGLGGFEGLVSTLQSPEESR